MNDLATPTALERNAFSAASAMAFSLALTLKSTAVTAQPF